MRLFKLPFCIPGALFAAALFSVATSASAAALEQRSSKEAGIVTVSSDLVANEGRLVIKIVAFNKTAAPAELSAGQVTLKTGAGNEVGLVTLAELEDDTRVAFGEKREHRPGDYASTSAMQRPTIITSSGQPDVSGYTGGNGVISSVAPAGHKQSETRNPKLKEALDGLRAAILQSVSIAPNTAGGGNVVTKPIKFARKEPRHLQMTVEFAGELHAFSF